MARLQTRVTELEAELERSKTNAITHESPGTGASDALAEENASLIARISSLEAESSTRVNTAREEADKLASQLREVTDSRDALRLDMDACTTKSAAQIAELESGISKFKDENEKIALELAQLKIAKTASDEETVALKAKLTSTTTSLEDEKRELTQEVDELRLAGQVSLAPPFHSSMKLMCNSGNYCAVRGAPQQRRGESL